MWDHRQLGVQFSLLAAREAVPDIIHCGFPTIELAHSVCHDGRENFVPLVLDVRDMWPEIFVDVLPKLLQPLGRIALSSQFRMAKESFKMARAISGHAPGFCDYGLKLGGRKKSLFDRAFPFGYEKVPLSQEELRDCELFWSTKGITNKPGEFNVCFFGTMGDHQSLDLDTPIKAVKLKGGSGKLIRLVLCGQGPRREKLMALAGSSPNVIFPGIRGCSEDFCSDASFSLWITGIYTDQRLCSEHSEQGC